MFFFLFKLKDFCFSIFYCFVINSEIKLKALFRFVNFFLHLEFASSEYFLASYQSSFPTDPFVDHCLVSLSLFS